MSYQDRLLGYESDKKAFIKSNPGYTVAEYDACIRFLVEKWGI